MSELDLAALKELAEKATIGRTARSGSRTRTTEYRIWCNMRQRTTNPNSRFYHRYGGRGIVICERWKNSFESFLEDMGARPSTLHSIDRIDNDLGYFKENCRWATSKEQNRNRCNNHRITIDGVTRTVIEWSEVSGVPMKIISRRILEHGWDPERAVFIPLRKNRPRYIADHRITIDGVTKTAPEWSEEYGIPLRVISERIRRNGWDAERAVTQPRRRVDQNWRKTKSVQPIAEGA